MRLREAREIRDLLIRIDTKVQDALARQDDHENRIRALERRVLVAAGAAAAAGGVAGRLFGLL